MAGCFDIAEAEFEGRRRAALLGAVLNLMVRGVGRHRLSFRRSFISYRGCNSGHLCNVIGLDSVLVVPSVHQSHTDKQADE